MNTSVLAGLALLALVPSVTGCASQHESGGLCPLSLERGGATYYALRAQHHVQATGPALGDVRFACATDDEAGKEDARARFRAVSLRGIDPATAFAVPSRWPRYVFYAGPSNARSFPPKIQKLLDR